MNNDEIIAQMPKGYIYSNLDIMKFIGIKKVQCVDCDGWYQARSRHSHLTTQKHLRQTLYKKYGWTTD